MGSAKHTEGRLEVVRDDTPGILRLDGLDFPVSVVVSALDLTFKMACDRERDLHRLAACWNACLGMEDPEHKIRDLLEFEETDHTEKDLVSIAALSNENTKLRAQLDEAKKLTGTFCYCGIPGEPCDGWHGGLCISAGSAPQGSADRLRHQLAEAERERDRLRVQLSGAQARVRYSEKENLVRALKIGDERARADEAVELLGRLRGWICAFRFDPRFVDSDRWDVFYGQVDDFLSKHAPEGREDS